MDGSQLAEAILPEVENLTAILKSRLNLIRVSHVHVLPRVNPFGAQIKAVRRAQEYRDQMKTALRETRCRQIDKAAARLAARGAILNHGTILEEAGLTRGHTHDPEIDALLREWVRRYASVDG